MWRLLLLLSLISLLGCANDLGRRMHSDWPVGMAGPLQGSNGNRGISSEKVIKGKDTGMEWLSNLPDVDWKSVSLIISIVLSGFVGYVVGVVKAFREQKLRAYEEILPIFIKMAFEPDKSNEAEFNKATIKAWLFASKKVARKVDRAISILVDPQRGNAMEALQDAIAEMRSDIQCWRWQRMKPTEISHFYTKIGKKN